MQKNTSPFKQSELISLKEASQITGYSSDYIGQLIRGGKIAGRQVYCNVAWMTTVKAVMDYKKSAKQNQKSFFGKIKKNLRMIGMELNAMKLFFQTFKTILPMVFIVLILFFSIVFLLGVSLNSGESKAAPKVENHYNGLQY